MARTLTNRPAFRPRVEHLEDRTTPAQFGVPWNDPMHLSLSFARDGTTAAGEPSRLNTALDARMPRAVWQDAILRAFQAWAEVANVNVGVVPDGGQPFGVAGATQRDPRFGDIRVGGLPMTAEALAVSVPPAAFVTGTFAGDVFVNTAAAHTAESLYAVALHEAGHALGLPHNTDPASVMFSHLNRNVTLTAGDVSAVRALYGPRLADANEGSKGNGTIKEATRLKYSVESSGYDGSTPVVGYGDLTTRTDADVYFLKGFPGYTGPVTFRVHTAGVSLMTPRATLTDRAGRVLAQGTATARGVLSLTLPTTVPDERYYLRVEAAPKAPYKVGRFAVVATFDGLLRPTATPLDEVIRGPYETLSPEEMHQFFRDPASVLFSDDLHADDEAAFAVNLRPGPGQPSDRHFRTTASLGDGTDVDFYRVTTPNSATPTPWVLTASVQGLGANGVVPRVEVYDAALVRVPVGVVVNGNGTFAVQATGARAGASYYVRVAGPTTVGNYALDVTIGTAAAELRPLAAGSLPQAASQVGYKLYVGQTQLFSLALSASGAAGAVRMDVVNAAGATLVSLTAGVGETVTGLSTLLPPGEYTVRYTAVGSTGPLSFALRGGVITDPVGPVKDSTTLTPQYRAPTDPTKFLYPDGTLTADPYRWVFGFLV